MEWISVEDRLPEINSPLLGTDGTLIFAAYWCEDSEKYKVGGWEGCCYCGGASVVKFTKAASYERLITHWMSLPDLPNQTGGKTGIPGGGK